MYIHLFVLVDTPANSSLRMYSLLYLPLFVIVDTPVHLHRVGLLIAVSTLICNSRYTIKSKQTFVCIAVSTLICNSRYTRNIS